MNRTHVVVIIASSSEGCGCCSPRRCAFIFGRSRNTRAFIIHDKLFIALLLVVEEEEEEKEGEFSLLQIGIFYFWCRSLKIQSTSFD